MVDMCRIRATRSRKGIIEKFNDAWSVEETHAMLGRTTFWASHAQGVDPANAENAEVGGSGTLVKGEWGQGVLTAGHCLRAAEQGKVMAVTTEEAHKRNPCRMIAFLVPEKMLAQARVYPNHEEKMRGPDIAFVPLDTQTMMRMENSAGAVFHNIDRDLKRNEQRFNGQIAIFQAIGHARSDGIAVKEVDPKPANETRLIPRPIMVRRSREVGGIAFARGP